MPRRDIYQKRFESCVCVECGARPAEEYTRCEHCREVRKAQKFRYRRAHRRELLARQRVAGARLRAEYERSGRCKRCGVLLDADSDAGYVTCVTCRSTRYGSDT